MVPFWTGLLAEIEMYKFTEKLFLKLQQKTDSIWIRIFGFALNPNLDGETALSKIYFRAKVYQQWLNVIRLRPIPDAGEMEKELLRIKKISDTLYERWCSQTSTPST